MLYHVQVCVSTFVTNVHEHRDSTKNLRIAILFIPLFSRACKMADKPSNAPPPTLSLYDDLLGASNPNATISAAPVLYKKDGGAGEEDVKSKLAKIQQSLNAGQNNLIHMPYLI